MPDVNLVIRFKDVSKTFKRPDGRGDFVAVDKLSFEVGKGEIVAVLGKTGCGKSTMFNIVAGLIEPSAGEATVVNHNPFGEFDFFRGKIGIVFQNDRLMPWRSALDNVMVMVPGGAEWKNQKTPKIVTIPIKIMAPRGTAGPSPKVSMNIVLT